jgi:glycosyltransferase involved in cell wall biosynthesis
MDFSKQGLIYLMEGLTMGKAIDRVLVTGGLGFIGSHVVDLLVEKGYEVSIFDNLEPQVHGEARKLPDYVNRRAELLIGDMRDKEALAKALTRLLMDNRLREKLSKNALEWSRQFSWDKTAEEFLRMLNNIVKA